MTTSDKQNQLKLDQLFYYKIIDRLAHLGKSSMLTSVAIALLVCAVFWDRIETLLLAVWASAILIFVLIRAALIRQFWRMNLESTNLRRWVRQYVFMIYCSAACWGILPFLEIFHASDWARSFLIFVAAGMSSGGMVSLYPLLYAAIPYILIIMLPLMIVLAQGPDLSLIVMSVMAGLFAISLVRSSFVLNEASNHAIRQHIENKELFRFLKKIRGVELSDIECPGEWTI